MITLANLPESRWQNLLHLDIIKARNKPTSVVEKPKDAPFFLPTVVGPDGQTRCSLLRSNSKNFFGIYHFDFFQI